MNKYIIYELEQLEKITGYSLQHIKNDINDVYNKLQEKDKEIKRLNKKYEDAVADYEEQKYIISELEKEINYEINHYDKNVDVETETLSGEFLRGIAWEADYLKMKLKTIYNELKEGK